MQIQVHADHQIDRRDELIQKAEDEANHMIGRFEGQVTRIEIQLNDVNGDKAGDHDKRCMMEARVSGHQPLAVTELAGSMEQAIHGASKKLRRLLDHTLGRISDSKGRDSIRTEAAPDMDMAEEPAAT